MALLKDVLDGKGGGGEFFAVEDIEKNTVTITENIHQGIEIREHATGKVYEDKKGKKKEQKYYCIEVDNGKERKDAHFTWTGLKQLSEKLPVSESWKGYQFVIDEVQRNASDKATGKLTIRILGKVEVAQSRLNELLDPAGKIVVDLKKADSWEDGAFWELATKHVGSMGAAVGIVEKLKTEGRIFQPTAKTWKAT